MAAVLAFPDAGGIPVAHRALLPSRADVELQSQLLAQCHQGRHPYVHPPLDAANGALMPHRGNRHVPAGASTEGKGGQDGVRVGHTCPTV